MARFPKIAQLKDVAALRQRCAELGIGLPVDDRILSAEEGSPLADMLDVGSFRVGNRWCIHPMEGWDAHRDGSPSAHTLRRWEHFGHSGAKLIWGGEAAAVMPNGRANPRQTLATPENEAGLARLLDALNEAHRARYGTLDDLLVGLQLTHSGRFSRPNRGDCPEPRIAYHHPLLDQKFSIDPEDDSVVWTDDEFHRLIDRFVEAAGVAERVGFRFVDVKACHGYLLHETLSARTRAGPFGGDLEGRSRLLRTIVGRVRDAYPHLMIGVRLSVFDVVPYATSRDVGRPMPYEDLLPYEFGFGTSADDPLRMDLDEPIRLLKQLQQDGVTLVNLSCSSPYYAPHIQRPAYYPPSDGYLPPEDPLIGVFRQIDMVRQCKQAVAALPMVGSGYSYLQDYLPHVAQAVVRAEWVDLVGLGRMVLSYPELPADTLAGRGMDRRRICRTFSDCTTAPRAGMVSGCYPLDAYYKAMPEADRLKVIKRDLRGR